MIEYKDYKKSEGDSKFISLKQALQQDGDQIELECMGGKIVPGEQAKFGTSRLDLTVKHEGKEKVLSCDAPDVANNGKGSQVYRGIKDNNIQPGDKFVIVHGGKMNNLYKTTIYDVRKDVLQEKPADWEEPDDEVVLDTSRDEEVRTEDIPF